LNFTQEGEGTKRGKERSPPSNINNTNYKNVSRVESPELSPGVIKISASLRSRGGYSTGHRYRARGK